ncbi:MAG: DMT family transporter [Rhodospirillales bacterium]
MSYRSASPTLPVQNAMRGIAMICAAYLLFSCLDAVAKLLGQSYPVTQIVWARFAVHAGVAIMLVAPYLRERPWRTGQPELQVVRGLLLVAATATNFTALRYLQLAETSAIYFATPLLVAALSVPLLGERVGPRRWAAIVAGFVGVLIVARPGFGLMHWAAGIALSTTLIVALYQILSRKLAGGDGARTTQFLTAMLAAVATAPLAAVEWVQPDALGWALMVLLGILGGIGHWLLAVAHAHAPAPVLAPFNYTQIAWMPLLGYLVFADVPSIWTAVGGAVVVASGLYLLHREQVAKPIP